MNYKMVKTRKTKEVNFDVLEYEYELTFDGDCMLLRTRWLKNGVSGGGRFSSIEAEDIPTIEEVFPGLKFECFQYDGTPIFNHNGERFHLVPGEQVTIGEDSLEV